MMDNKHYINWNELDSLIRNLKSKIDHGKQKPDIIMGISRGGLVPGVMLSHLMDLPMIPLRWSTRDFLYSDEDTINDISQEIEEGKTILIVDDICDTGHTFHLLADFFDNIPYDIKNRILWASIHVRAGTKFEPDYYSKRIDDQGWVVYPYEGADV